MTVVIHRLSILIVYLSCLYVRAAIQKYIIYPKHGLSSQDGQQLTEKIKNLAGTLGDLYISTWRSEIRFWLAGLNEKAYEELRGNSQVRATKYVFDATNNRC